MDSSQIIRIVYSAASLQGIFLAILLLRSRNNQPANRILSILLFLLSFHLVLVGFDDREFFMTFPHLSRISWIIGTLYWPLLFMFVASIMRHSIKAWLYPLLFVPFIFFLIQMLPYYQLDAEMKRFMLQDFERARLADFGWINQAVSMLHIVFQGGLLMFYITLESRLKDEYSGADQVRIEWLRTFLILVFCTTIIAVLAFFARSFELPVLSSIYNFHFIGLVFLFYWLSYKALTDPVVFGLVNAPASKEKQPAKMPRDSEAKSQSDFNKIKDVLGNRKLYLKPNLTLTELADAAHLPRHQVSQAINSVYGGNFFDLINELRVEEFKNLVKDPSKKNLSLLGIAQESGFSSKASFYSVFKKKTGLTPSEFAERQS